MKVHESKFRATMQWLRVVLEFNSINPNLIIFLHKTHKQNEALSDAFIPHTRQRFRNTSIAENGWREKQTNTELII